MRTWRRGSGSAAPCSRTSRPARRRASRAGGRKSGVLLLAELDGELAGSGLADRSDIRRPFGRRAARVAGVPAARRRHGAPARARGARRRFGVGEARRSWTTRARRRLPSGSASRGRPAGRAGEDARRRASRRLPDGVEVVTVERAPPAARARRIRSRARATPTSPPTGRSSVSLEDWLREEATLPGGSFVALAGGEIVGYSGLMRHDNPGVAEDGLTVVRRDWRRRGLALALKRLELAWAAAERRPRDGHLDAARQRGHAAAERATRLRVPRRSA